MAESGGQRPFLSPRVSCSGSVRRAIGPHRGPYSPMANATRAIEPAIRASDGGRLGINVDSPNQPALIERSRPAMRCRLFRAGRGLFMTAAWRPIEAGHRMTASGRTQASAPRLLLDIGYLNQLLSVRAAGRSNRVRPAAARGAFGKRTFIKSVQPGKRQRHANHVAVEPIQGVVGGTGITNVVEVGRSTGPLEVGSRVSVID